LVVVQRERDRIGIGGGTRRVDRRGVGWRRETGAIRRTAEMDRSDKAGRREDKRRAYHYPMIVKPHAKTPSRQR
jgi:hypothetical protein